MTNEESPLFAPFPSSLRAFVAVLACLYSLPKARGDFVFVGCFCLHCAIKFAAWPCRTSLSVVDLQLPAQKPALARRNDLVKITKEGLPSRDSAPNFKIDIHCTAAAVYATAVPLFSSSATKTRDSSSHTSYVGALAIVHRCSLPLTAPTEPGESAASSDRARLPRY